MSNTKFADFPSGNSDAFGYVSNITTLNLDGAENILPMFSKSLLSLLATAMLRRLT